jgi:hypothetical protein
VKVSNVSWEAYGIPSGVSKIGVIVTQPIELPPRSAFPYWVYLYGAPAVYVLQAENIRAWMRKPLDLEL